MVNEVTLSKHTGFEPLRASPRQAMTLVRYSNVGPSRCKRQPPQINDSNLAVGAKGSHGDEFVNKRRALLQVNQTGRTEGSRTYCDSVSMQNAQIFSVCEAKSQTMNDAANLNRAVRTESSDAETQTVDLAETGSVEASDTIEDLELGDNGNNYSSISPSPELSQERSVLSEEYVCVGEMEKLRPDEATECMMLEDYDALPPLPTFKVSTVYLKTHFPTTPKLQQLHAFYRRR
eukprot:Platyproteum_vivax@DN7364_c1_g1_i5.p1